MPYTIFRWIFIFLYVFCIALPSTSATSIPKSVFKEQINIFFHPIQHFLYEHIGYIRYMHQDDHILRFVSADVPLENTEYRPDDLVSLSGAYINQAGRNSLVRAKAKPHLDALAKHFFDDFNEKIIIISAFRDAKYQQRLWDLGRCDDGHFCAKPGYSEHQLGLALDFFDATSEKEYFTNPRYKEFVMWMQQYAHLYGFTQSYQKGVTIDHYEPEPWHWRYVGIPMAKKLYRLNLTYTQYYESIHMLYNIYTLNDLWQSENGAYRYHPPLKAQG